MLTRNTKATLTVESRTVEEALAAISDKLGPDVEVLGAQKVVRGGVGGFFSKEMVQISARPATAVSRSSLDAAYDEIVEEAGEAEFHDLLQSRMAEETTVEIDLTVDEASDEDVRVTLHRSGHTSEEAAVVAAMLAGPTAVAPAAAEPSAALESIEATAAPTPVAPIFEPDAAEMALVPSPDVPKPDQPRAVESGPRIGWRIDALLALRLPAGIIRACEGLDPAADLEWVSAIADASAALCGDLGDEPTVFAGPGAHHLAPILGLPAARAGDPAPEGSFCATVHPGEADRDWLAVAMGGRRLHLVVGDHDWEPLMIERPVAVSWTGDRALPGALYLAAALGIPLGYGGTGGFPVGVARVDAVDIALAIRRLARA